MKILWLTPALPSPITGNRSRQFYLIKHLANQHDFYVLSFIQNFETPYLNKLNKYCKRVVSVPLKPVIPPEKWRNRYNSWQKLFFDPKPKHVRIFPMHLLMPALDEMLSTEEYDLMHLETLLPTSLRLDQAPKRALLSTQNIESGIQRRRFDHANKWSRKLAYGIELIKLKAYEKRQFQSFPYCVTVSQEDAAVCKQMAPYCDVRVVHNGVDCSYFAKPQKWDNTNEMSIVFTGMMDQSPNVDGVIYFTHEIWPVVKRAFPNLSLVIAGANPTEDVSSLTILPGVTVTGIVDDMRPYLWNATLGIVPLRLGGGTRLKILEAMAACLPVISTTIGAEGLDVTNGENILLADNPREFSQAVLRLINNPELRGLLRQNARRLVEEKYDWQIIAHQLDLVYQSLFNSEDPPD